MIASGMCLMGGCYAEDEVGKVLDTYWAAEFVETPSSTPVLIFEIPFVGGDSANDEMCVMGYLPGVFTENTNYGGIGLGVGNVTLSQNSWYRCAMFLTWQQKPCVVTGNQVVSREASDGCWHFVSWDKGVVSWSWAGGETIYSHGQTYALSDSQFRKRAVCAGVFKMVAYMSYNNMRTGCKWCVRPLRSVAGGEAFWIDDEETLVEI